MLQRWFNCILTHSKALFLIGTSCAICHSLRTLHTTHMVLCLPAVVNFLNSSHHYIPANYNLRITVASIPTPIFTHRCIKKYPKIGTCAIFVTLYTTHMVLCPTCCCFITSIKNYIISGPQLQKYAYMHYKPTSANNLSSSSLAEAIIQCLHFRQATIPLKEQLLLWSFPG